MPRSGSAGTRALVKGGAHERGRRLRIPTDQSVDAHLETGDALQAAFGIGEGLDQGGFFVTDGVMTFYKRRDRGSPSH